MKNKAHPNRKRGGPWHTHPKLKEADAKAAPTGLTHPKVVPQAYPDIPRRFHAGKTDTSHASVIGTAEDGLAPLATDLLILCDGTVLAHNLTPAMAALLHRLNPEDETMRLRTRNARARLASSAADRRVGTPKLRH